MNMIGDIRYYDVRHVKGQTTHIDIDNSVIESAGTSFFSTAVIRVLGPSGWGILTIDNYSSPKGREFESLLSSAISLATYYDGTCDSCRCPPWGAPVYPR